MKYTVMLRILFMLLAKRKITAREVADRFDISTRSVYRYIDELTLAHVPIISDRGAGGGFYLPDSYKLPASFLTKSEFEKLTSILNAFSGEITDDPELSSIKEKLFSSTRHTAPTRLSSASLIIDGSSWNGLGGYKEKMKVISKAIADCVSLKISYHDRNGECTKRLIEPHALILKQGIWYVYAFCRLRNDFRLFKVTRIEYANYDKEFIRRDFSAELLPFSEWENAKNEHIELLIDPSIKCDVEEWLGVDCVTEERGTIVASCELPYDDSLISEIMKYGRRIKVLKPEKLKADIVATANQLIDLYD